MIRKYCLYFLTFGILLNPPALFAQEEVIEEESAAVSLEDYTDEFQENFFEALKQKGIENYDKAINLLLECKRLDPENSVVDHELANVYLADKQYVLAREYGLEALISEPVNYWYLQTLLAIEDRLGNSMNELLTTIPYANEKLKENLALIYYKRRNYQNALNVIKEIKKSDFSDHLSLKIKDSLDQNNQQTVEEESQVGEIGGLSPLESYKSQITALIETKNYTSLLETAAEAVENFPAQPYFYYAHGLALNKSSKPQEAVAILESALDFLLDDAEMADKIYRELAAAHTTLGNVSKANMYLSKIKSGS
jgi:tetratricopeptide (TPR) repeat protein